MKKLKVLIAAVVFLGISFTLTRSLAHAANINYTANANWDQSSCTANINGTTADTKNGFGVAKGDTLNLSLVNQSTIPLVVAITLGGSSLYSGPDLAPGATYSHTYTNLQSNLVVQAAADGYTNPCGFKNMTTGMVTLQPGSATLSCATVQGNKGYGWDLSGNYSNVVTQASIFEGSTNIASFTDGTNSLSGQNFVAGTTATTFYFYNGFTASDRLLAQVTCQPPPAAAGGTGGSSAASTSQTTTTATPTTSPASPQSTSIAMADSSNSPVQLKSISVAGKAVNSDKPLEFTQTQPLTLSGHTVANGTVTLTIHSTPKTVTVKADSNGDWSYVVIGLAPGSHYVEASVTVPDSQQASVTNKLISFKVDAAAAAVSTKATNNKDILIGSAAVVALGVVAAGYFALSKRKKLAPVSINTVSPSMIAPTTVVPVQNPTDQTDQKDK